MKLNPAQQMYFALVKSDFRAFMRHAFSSLYTNKTLQWNWHLDAIVHALEENLAGRSTRVITTYRHAA